MGPVLQVSGNPSEPKVVALPGDVVVRDGRGHHVGPKQRRMVLKLGVVLHERRREPADVGRGHAAAAQVRVAELGSRQGGRDRRAGPHEIRLHASVSGRPPAAPVVEISDREVSVVEDVADGQGVLRDARTPDRLAARSAVAAADHVGLPVRPDLVVELPRGGIRAGLPDSSGAAADVDHLRCRRAALRGVRHEVHAAFHPALEALVVALPDLANPDVLGASHAGGHPAKSAVGGAGSGDRGQDVGAMPVLIVERAGGVGREVEAASKLVQVGVPGDRGTRVEDANPRRGATESRGKAATGADPVRVDERGALVMSRRGHLDHLDEQHEVQRADLLDGRRRGHRAIEEERGVVLADRGPRGFQLPPEVAALVPLEEIDDDRKLGARVDGDTLPLRRTKRTQLGAHLLMGCAHPDPFDLGERRQCVDRPDGQPGLVMAVVRPEEPDPKTGQLLLERSFERSPQPQEPVHELPALRPQSVRLRLQRGVEAGGRRQETRRKAERARGFRTRLPPRVRLIPGDPRRRNELRRRRGRGRNRDAYPLSTGADVGDERSKIGRAPHDRQRLLRLRAGSDRLGHGRRWADRPSSENVVRRFRQELAGVRRRRDSVLAPDGRRESGTGQHGDHRQGGSDKAPVECASSIVTSAMCHEHLLCAPRSSAEAPTRAALQSLELGDVCAVCQGADSLAAGTAQAAGLSCRVVNAEE